MIVCQDELKAHLRSPAQTTCILFLVQLRTQADGSPGEVRAFAQLNQDVTFDLEAWMVSMSLAPPPGIVGTGSQTYVAVNSQVASDIAGNLDLSPDNLEIDGAMDLPSFTEQEINDGVWDFASIVAFLVNYEDLSMGALILRAGKIGDITIERNSVKAEFRGVAQAYSRTIVRLLAPSCSWNLGDSRCTVNIALSAAATWEDTTAYAAGINVLVIPTTPNGYWYQASVGGVSGGSEPTWDTSPGGITVDGTVTWVTTYPRAATFTVDSVGDDGLTFYTASLTQPGPSGGIAITDVSQGNPGVVTTASPLGLGNYAAVTIYGVTGMVQVNGDTLIRNPSGNTFELSVDTSAYPAYISGGTVAPLGGASAGYFSFGVVTWDTGDNAGFQMEVKTYAPGQVTLQLPMPRPIQAGDTGIITVGCGKTFVTDCKTKFLNQLNFGGFPYLPGIDRLILVGKQA